MNLENVTPPLSVEESKKLLVALRVMALLPTDPESFRDQIDKTSQEAGREFKSKGELHGLALMVGHSLLTNITKDQLVFALFGFLHCGVLSLEADTKLAINKASRALNDIKDWHRAENSGGD